MEQFSEIVAKERDRLTASRKSLQTKMDTLQEQLDGVDRELTALDAYEDARTGKKQKEVEHTSTRPRRNGVRDKVLAAIAEKPATSSEVRAVLGVKDDDKNGVQSIANALSALKRTGKLTINAQGAYEAVK